MCGRAVSVLEFLRNLRRNQSIEEPRHVTQASWCSIVLSAQSLGAGCRPYFRAGRVSRSLRFHREPRGVHASSGRVSGPSF